MLWRSLGYLLNSFKMFHICNAPYLQQSHLTALHLSSQFVPSLPRITGLDASFFTRASTIVWASSYHFCRILFAFHWFSRIRDHTVSDCCFRFPFSEFCQIILFQAIILYVPFYECLKARCKAMIVLRVTIKTEDIWLRHWDALAHSRSHWGVSFLLTCYLLLLVSQLVLMEPKVVLMMDDDTGDLFCAQHDSAQRAVRDLDVCLGESDVKYPILRKLLVG